MGYLEQNERTGRVVLPDLVRAWALFGIAVVNVAVFNSHIGYYGEDGLATAFDKNAVFAVNGLFLAKSYTLFSFMFGVGFAFQMSSAERQKANFGSRYGRRIAGLLILGLLHGVFFFVGDILFVYGLLGAALLLFRNLSVKSLMRWALALFLFQLIILGLMALLFYVIELDPNFKDELDLDEIKKALEKADKIYRNGSFFAVANQRAVDWTGMVFMGAFLQGSGVLAFFLAGYAAVKSGVLNNLEHPFWKKCRMILLPIGLLGSFYAAWIMREATTMFSFRYFWGMFLVFVFAPFSTAGYLGVMAKLSEGKIGPIKAFFARAGTASLTAYLMQSLILSFLFCGYGFGLYSKLGAGQVIMIAAATAIFTLVFTSLWRLKFERGPMEYLLRKWTYGGQT